MIEEFLILQCDLDSLLTLCEYGLNQIIRISYINKGATGRDISGYITFY